MLQRLRNQKGAAFLFIYAIVFFVFISGNVLVFLNQMESKRLVQSKKSTSAFYMADAGIEKALWELTQSASYAGEANTSLGNGSFDIAVTPLGGDRYQIVSTGKATQTTNPVERKIKATLEKDPIAQVFDYSYFINNWGWYWGHNITSNGDVRSNGRFDFVDGPKVEGHIYAGGDIDDHGTPIRGVGGRADHQHEYCEKLAMPNIQALNYYEQQAVASSGTITVNGNVLIDKVFGDDAGESGNIVLVGTASNPVEINGTVVIRGDIVIKGKITGQGTIYAGRNIYVADTLDYKKAPSSPRPAQGQTNDQWVAAHKDKDLVAYAARGSIVIGDYTKDPHYGYYGSDQWYSDQWLFNMGNEDVGLDGIPDTGDAGENDGIFDPTHEDIDGDGVYDDNYNWDDVQTQADITTFANVPPGVANFSDLASNSPNKIEGIFYTNHALAGRVGSSVQFNGSIISRDEAIIYRNNLVFNYDERAHSRYNGDPNRFIDLGLPRLSGVRLVDWKEIR